MNLCDVAMKIFMTNVDVISTMLFQSKPRWVLGSLGLNLTTQLLFSGLYLFMPEKHAEMNWTESTNRLLALQLLTQGVFATHRAEGKKVKLVLVVRQLIWQKNVSIKKCLYRFKASKRSKKLNRYHLSQCYESSDTR